MIFLVNATALTPSHIKSITSTLSGQIVPSQVCEVPQFHLAQSDSPGLEDAQVNFGESFSFRCG